MPFPSISAKRFLPVHFVLVLGLLMFWSACLEKCEEPDIQRINSLRFELDIDGENGFFSFEIEDVYLVRFIPFTDPLIADTFMLNGVFPEGPGRFLINDNFPFRNATPPYFTAFGYKVVDPNTVWEGTIDNITLRGEYTGDCDYVNLQRSFFFQGDSIDMGGSEEFFLISQ
jgi:hypothetical protein